MNSRRNEAEARDAAPRLYLIAEEGLAFPSPAAFAAVLGFAPVAAVLVRAGDGAVRPDPAQIAPMAAAVQARGLPFLLENSPELVTESGADGCHVAEPSKLAATLGALKPGFIVGAGGLRTRHDAMVAGEAGADYVMFGEPDAEGRRPGTAALLERVSWWTEVFEVPCVGYADDMDTAEALARAGADFVAVGAWVWTDPRGAAAALAEVWARLQDLEFAS